MCGASGRVAVAKRGHRVACVGFGDAVKFGRGDRDGGAKRSIQPILRDLVKSPAWRVGRRSVGGGWVGVDKRSTTL